MFARNWLPLQVPPCQSLTKMCLWEQVSWFRRRPPTCPHPWSSLRWGCSSPSVQGASTTTSRRRCSPSSRSRGTAPCGPCRRKCRSRRFHSSWSAPASTLSTPKTRPPTRAAASCRTRTGGEREDGPVTCRQYSSAFRGESVSHLFALLSTGTMSTCLAALRARSRAGAQTAPSWASWPSCRCGSPPLTPTVRVSPVSHRTSHVSLILFLIELISHSRGATKHKVRVWRVLVFDLRIFYFLRLNTYL